MSKKELDLPASFSFSTEIEIQICHINYGGHVGNDAFLSLIHEARIRFYKKNGFSELIGDKVLLMSDSYLQYKKEVFAGEKVKVFVAAGDFRKISFNVYYKMLNEKDELVLLARTGMACADIKKKKLVSIPQIVLKLSE